MQIGDAGARGNAPR